MSEIDQIAFGRMQGDEKYKLGELTADMAAVKRDIVDIKAGQKEILHRLDNLSVVSL